MKGGARGTQTPGAPLIERDRELSVLAEKLDAAVGGSGGLLLVEGAAGAGKTRLLVEAHRLAEDREMSCLSARSAELEQRVPFGVVRQLLGQPLGELDRSEAESVLGGVATPVNALLGGAPAAEQPPRDVLFALVHGIYWVCARLADRDPLVVVVDDLQWADEQSARALAYLCQRLEELRIAVVLSVRLGERSPADPGELVGESAGAVRITVPALSDAATARLLEELLGAVDPEFSRAVFAGTGGNPFLVREVAAVAATGRVATDKAGARQLSTLAPGSVAGWTLSRLGQLPDAARALADSLAVLERAELRVAAPHAELADEDARAGADRLAEAGLVEPTLPLAFTHPLVRRVLYEQLTPAIREAAHHRAATILSEQEAAPDQIAPHLLECRPRGEEWAVEVLHRAAVQAASRGGAEEAIHALRRARAEPGHDADPKLLFALGRAELMVGDPDAVPHLERAARSAGDPTLRVRARGSLGEAYFAAGDFRGAFEAARMALDEVPPGRGGAGEAALVIGALTGGRMVPELVDEVGDVLTVPRLGPDGEPTPGEVARAAVAGLDCFHRGRRSAALIELEWVVDRLRDTTIAESLPIYTLGVVGFVLANLDEHEAAETVIREAFRRAWRRGSPLETAGSHEVRAWIRWRQGDVNGALADADTALALTDGGWGVPGLSSRVVRALTLLELDDVEGARKAIATNEGADAKAQGGSDSLRLAYARGCVAFRTGELEAALSEALAAGERALAMQSPTPEYLPWRSLAARCAAALGDRERGLALSREELDLAREIDSPRAAGLALVAVGSIEQGAAGAEMLASAVELLDRADADLERCRARIELGSALRRTGRNRDARGPLRDALDTARRIGATALAHQAHAELQAAGGRPRRERSTGAGSLTARERQTAELAASGLTNPQIAERLFVTRKTVEAHLRSIFRKLAVSGRDELSEVLAASFEGYGSAPE
jgi:DNA-binding CsgD family transcriptional regulator